MSKLSLLAAAAVGYVLGARAGRQRYDQIADYRPQGRRQPEGAAGRAPGPGRRRPAGGRGGRGRQGQGVVRGVQRGRQGAWRGQPDRDAGDAVRAPAPILGNLTELPHPVTGQPFPSPVPPGTGWPDDPATPETPVARTPARCAASPPAPRSTSSTPEVSVCRACPRLVRWREDVARGQAGVVRRRAVLGPADPRLGRRRPRAC